MTRARGAAGWRLLVVGLALIAVGGRAEAAWGQAAGEPLALVEYRARLEEAERRLAGGAEPADPAIQAALGGTTSVRLPGGAVVLAQPLAPEEAPRAVVLERVRLVQGQLAAAGGDRTAARLARLEAVLAQPQFAGLAQGPTLLERLGEWLRTLFEWLGGVLPRPAGGSGSPIPSGAAEGIAWLVAGLGGVAVAILLSYWLTRLLGGFVAEAEARRRREAGAEEPLTAVSARRQAQAQAQAGQYRQAVRSLYLSALLHLEERGLVRADRSLTNREYLAQAAVAEEVRRHLQPVVQTFDAVWYGVREPDGETFARYQREIDALNEAIAR